MQLFPPLTTCVFPYRIDLKIFSKLCSPVREKNDFPPFSWGYWHKQLKWQVPRDSFKTLEFVPTFGDLMVNSITIQVTLSYSLTWRSLNPKQPRNQEWPKFDFSEVMDEKGGYLNGSRKNVDHGWGKPLFILLKFSIKLLSIYCLFSGPSQYNNRMLGKLSLFLSFSSIQLLYSEGPLNKEWVLFNVMRFIAKENSCLHI